MCCGSSNNDYEDEHDEFWAKSTANPKNHRGHVSNSLALIAPDQRHRKHKRSGGVQSRPGQPFYIEDHNFRHGPMFDDMEPQPLKPAYTRRHLGSGHHGAGSRRRYGQYYHHSPLSSKGRPPKNHKKSKMGPPVAFFNDCRGSNNERGGKKRPRGYQSTMPMAYRPSGLRAARVE